MRKNFNDLKNLYENDIFAGIEPKETDSMLKCLNAKILSYKKGSALLLAGDEINWIGIVLSGVVHIIKEDYYGNRNIMAKAGAGQLFGEVFACSGTKSSPVSVFAAEDTEVMFLNCSKVLTVCSGSCPFHCLHGFQLAPHRFGKSPLSESEDRFSFQTYNERKTFSLFVCPSRTNPAAASW